MPDNIVIPDIELSPDMIKRMNDIGSEIDKAERLIAVLKDMDMDTRELDEKLEWSKKIRNTLLKNFTK